MSRVLTRRYPCGHRYTRFGEPAAGRVYRRRCDVCHRRWTVHIVELTVVSGFRAVWTAT